MEQTIENRCIELLLQAIEFNASDIHLKPSEHEYLIYFRKYNQLVEIGGIAFNLGEKMISHYKYQSYLDISEKRKPQSGAFEFKTQDKIISCRISTLPSAVLKESIVIRLMLENMTVPLKDLALEEETNERLKKLMYEKQGIILLSGPTGCGKSTTMYSLLKFSTEQLAKHVITLEDPVENNQHHMLQVQVNERSGVTYAVGLKAILRHTPDIIMIGEIRDRETANIAIEAALTGHLVISTIHAKNSFGCLHRLKDLGVSTDEMQQTIISVISQKLVTKNDAQQNLSAVFELLDGEHLTEAFQYFKQGETYELPLEETLRYQIIRGVRNETIIPNVLTL